MRQPGKSDKDVEKIEDWFVEGTDSVMRMPIRSLEDLVVLAAIAVHWNSDPDADETYPQCVIDDDRHRYLDKRALAHLVKGILDLAGVKLDSEGRLLQLS